MELVLVLRQDVLWELESDYRGTPYYVTGNAILHALAHRDRIDYHEQQQLNVSHGVFCPAVYGVFPDWHSKAGGRMSFASTLKPIERYEDLFIFRRASHPWIHDNKPRDAFNTPTCRKHCDDYAMNAVQNMTVSAGERPHKRSWYIHAYLTAPKGSDVLPLPASDLDGLQFGGNRNYGYGQVSLKDTQDDKSKLTDLDQIDYGRVADADGHVLELMTPYVLSSEYPHTQDRGVPNWWDQSLTYRTRVDKIAEQREMYELETVDHGQVTKYYGSRPVETAKNGVERIGTHSKYGFGEIWVRPTASENDA